MAKVLGLFTTSSLCMNVMLGLLGWSEILKKKLSSFVCSLIDDGDLAII